MTQLILLNCKGEILCQSNMQLFGIKFYHDHECYFTMKILYAKPARAHAYYCIGIYTCILNMKDGYSQPSQVRLVSCPSFEAVASHKVHASYPSSSSYVSSNSNSGYQVGNGGGEILGHADYIKFFCSLVPMLSLSHCYIKLKAHYIYGRKRRKKESMGPLGIKLIIIGGIENLKLFASSVHNHYKS